MVMKGKMVLSQMRWETLNLVRVCSYFMWNTIMIIKQKGWENKE